jgi:ABC-type Mn2+/Zn2+ transport system permease subunit
LEIVNVLAALSLWELIRRGWDVLIRDYHWFIAKPLDIALLERSLEAAIIVGIVSGVVGSLVVVRGMSFFADALSHTILPGVAIMYQRSRAGNLPDLPGGSEANPLLWGALGAGIFSTLLIGFLTRHERLRSDTAIGIVFAGMFALGIAMVSRVENYSGDLTHILFGQILGVGRQDLNIIIVFSGIVLLIVAVFYKEFMLISFDPLLAKTLRLPTEFFRYLLLLLIATTIVVSLQIVGISLMLALLITPAATASLITHRLHWMMMLAALIGAACSIVGFYASYHLDVATGPAIVLAATGIFGFVFAEQSLQNWARRSLNRWRES